MQSDTTGLLPELFGDWFRTGLVGPSNARLNEVGEVHCDLHVGELAVDVLWHDYTSHMVGLNEGSGGRGVRPSQVPSSVHDLP